MSPKEIIISRGSKKFTLCVCSLLYTAPLCLGSMSSSEDSQPCRGELATVHCGPNRNAPRMLTTHPSDSYKLEKDAKGLYELQITNAQKFWSVSRYLVMQVK